MAFGLTPYHLGITPNQFSIIFNASKRMSFTSHDSLGLKKPPIL
jgi:hypothetical protein